MRVYEYFSCLLLIALATTAGAQQADSTVWAEGRVLNAETKERLLQFDLHETLCQSWGLAVVDQNTKRIVNHLVLPRNSVLPCQSCLSLELTESTSRNVLLSIFRGDAIDCDACDHYCDILIESGTLGFTKGSKIDVIFSSPTEDEFEIQVFDAASGTKLELVKEWRIQQ